MDLIRTYKIFLIIKIINNINYIRKIKWKMKMEIKDFTVFQQWPFIILYKQFYFYLFFFKLRRKKENNNYINLRQWKIIILIKMMNSLFKYFNCEMKDIGSLFIWNQLVW